MDDLSPQLRSLLGARKGEVWLIRPDGRIAAVTDTMTGYGGVDTALHRLLGAIPSERSE